MPDRYSPFRNIARQRSIDAIALVPGSNFSRLYGKSFHESERPLLVLIPLEGLPLAVVPDLELSSFAEIGFEGDVIPWKDQGGYQSAFDRLLELAAIKSIAVEGQVMRVFVDQALRKAEPSLVIDDAQDDIAALRLCKTSSEIKAIQHAIFISENALADTIDRVQVGMTEVEIKNVLVQQLFKHGAEDLSFQPIVAAAENSAQPHAHCRNDYQIKAGDALLIDFGARAAGVCADITRTFFVQHCSDEHAKIYETVLAANLAGIAAARPGGSAHSVDDAATTLLEQSAYASRIQHKTGHGMGRDIHEPPYIMRGNHQLLEPGMVFTIEPGLYDTSDIGIRIEDDVLITNNGVQSLTSFDKSLTLIA